MNGRLRGRPADLAGRRFGKLVARESLPERDKYRNIRWVCDCDCGRTLVTIAHSLLQGKAGTCGCARSRPQAVVGYTGAHDRVRRRFGSASTHPCVDCGKQAMDWSYNGGDAQELYDVTTQWHCAYSLRPEFYVPRCRLCHRNKDRGGVSGERE
jgi:hypothetical protein